MAVDHVRNIIREHIDEVSLDEFEAQCKTVDSLLGVLERETDPEAAYTLAIGWASSVLSLARIESALLSSVLPEFESELEEIDGKIAILDGRRRDAENMVYELRGSSGDVMPLSMKTDPRRTKEIADAKEARNQVFAEVRKAFVPLNAERIPLMEAIGGISRTLRALSHFVEHRFPIPSRKRRNPMAPTSPDPRADPLAAFATHYVEGMADRKAKQRAAKAAAERTRLADARPMRDWDKLRDQDLANRGERVQ